MTKFVSYLRCSTVGQSDRHSIPAQRASVATYVKGAAILAEYVEVESGKRDDRPELRKALDHAKAANATLIASKLDRLGRRASHVLGLLDSATVPVVFADAPNAGALELGVRAVVAQEEARMISERTRAGLKAAKARGKVLGNPNGAAALRRYVTVFGLVPPNTVTLPRLRGVSERRMILPGVCGSRWSESCLRGKRRHKRLPMHSMSLVFRQGGVASGAEGRCPGSSSAWT